ncbi:MAG TPA: choice-of-anchor tandem repeat GloVer-containing protein [Chthoniobacterales bacterium]|jgi:uncharacterized repeat protein (TIGR03803 family)
MNALTLPCHVCENVESTSRPRSKHNAAAFLCCGIVTLLFNFASASTTQIIYSFAGDEDGEYADTDIALDSAGNIYGTTVSGGDFGGGTVWELTPSGQSWTHTVLYDFHGEADGGEPYKGVTLDPQGNLYGTAVTGGSGSCEGGCGVAYKVTKTGSKWKETVIHAFTGGDDGSGPGARLTLDGQGNLYGMTPTGGANGLGTIFQLHPDGAGHYTLNVIHTFTGSPDGETASAGRLILRGGKLYGVATAGGINGQGTAFYLTPTTVGEWNFHLIYSFVGEPNAGFPYSALHFDTAGNAYGTTYYAGANDLGSVYELTPTQSGEWSETELYSFAGGHDGSGPIGNVVSDRAGNLFGTTSEGGLGDGTIFKLKLQPGGTAQERVVHRFAGPPDGAYPYNGMTGDGHDHFYGATVHGGAADEGAIYQFIP